MIQKESMDQVLRTQLWNLCYSNFNFSLAEFSLTLYNELFISYWQYYFGETLDSIPEYTSDMVHYIKQYFFQSSWFEVYDFIEFTNQRLHKNEFIYDVNKILEKEMSAYRLVNGYIMEITSEEEMQSIEEAISVGDQRFLGKNKHLNEAIKNLSDRSAPNYRTSIKESISAVENVCRVLTGENDLTKSLNKLKGKPIHRFMIAGFEELYKYTNDKATGIRHALMIVNDQSTVEYEDAKFFLVTCSAFINYLIAKFG